MSSASSPNKSSRRTYSSLSCVGKRPDSSAFNSGDSEPFKVIKRPTIGVESDLLNHRGSGATLDDASSLVDQTSSLALSPAKTSSKTSLAAGSASQSDLLQMGQRLNSLTVNQRESMYVRTLFRYDPSRDRGLAARGLAFDHGDVLYVVNASDPEWWQACYAFPVPPPVWASAGGANSKSYRSPDAVSFALELPPLPPGRPAIIPSQRRVERRNRLTMKRVKFVDKDGDSGNGSSSIPSPWSAVGSGIGEATPNLTPFTPDGRFFGRGGEGSTSSIAAGDGSLPSVDSVSVGGTLERRKKTNSFSIFKRFSGRRDKKDLESVAIKKKSVSLEDIQSGYFGARLSRTYEIVHPVTLKMARPLIIFGPLKERITEELLRSDEFATCIQHTSRPREPGEVDGVDFHFYESKAAMQADISSGGGQFLDVVMRNDHFYATSIPSILEILRSGRICILDVNFVAIYRLQTAGLHPIAILLKPETLMQCRNLQRRLTVDQARKMHEACVRMESEYWYLFTAILNMESMGGAIASVNRVLQQHKGPRVWLPVDQPLQSPEKAVEPSSAAP